MVKKKQFLKPIVFMVFKFDMVFWKVIIFVSMIIVIQMGSPIFNAILNP